MIQTSQSFIDALLMPSRQWRAKLMHNGADTGASVKSITTKGGSNSEVNFIIGGVYSVSFEAVIDSDNFLWENKEIAIQLGLVLEDESIEWITLGSYTVDEVLAGRYLTTIRGVGTITAKCQGNFTAPSTQTIANIISAIQTQAGVTIAVDSAFSQSVVITKTLEGMVIQDVLQVMASMLGGYVTEKNDGTVYIGKYPSTSTITVSAERMIQEPTFNNYDTEITGVKVIVADAITLDDGTVVPEVSYQTQTYNTVIYNQYMTQEAFTDFASNLTGLMWRKASIPLALGDPRLEASDLMTIVVDGESYSVPCHNFVHQFDGGLQTTITSNGEIIKGEGGSGYLEQVAQRALTVATEAQEKIDNLKVGGRNMLLDTNAPSLTKVYGPTNRYFSDARVTDIVASMVEIADAPVDVQYGARFVCNGQSNGYRALTWYDWQGGLGKVDLIDGEEYTVSAYVRVTSGTQARIRFQYGNNTYISTDYTIEANNGEWQRISHTFVYDNRVSPNNTGARIYIGARATYEATVEMCGFMLERGNIATDYQTAPEETQAQIDNIVDKTVNYFWHDRAGAHVSNVENDATTGANTLVTSTAFQTRTGTTVDASFGSTTTIGRTGSSNQNVNIDNTGIKMRTGTTVDASFGYNSTAGTPVITLGRDNQYQTIINNAEFKILDPNDSPAVVIDGSYADGGYLSLYGITKLYNRQQASMGKLYRDSQFYLGENGLLLGNTKILNNPAGTLVRNSIEYVHGALNFPADVGRQFYLSSGVKQMNTDATYALTSDNFSVAWNGDIMGTPKYVAGEKITFARFQNSFAGHVTNGQKQIAFTIPLPKLATGRTCTLALANNGLTVRAGTGGYVDGGDINVNTSDYTVNCVPCAVGVYVYINKTTNYTNVSNNTACSIQIQGTLTFS